MNVISENFLLDNGEQRRVITETLRFSPATLMCAVIIHFLCSHSKAAKALIFSFVKRYLWFFFSDVLM